MIVSDEKSSDGTPDQIIFTDARLQTVYGPLV